MSISSSSKNLIKIVNENISNKNLYQINPNEIIIANRNHMNLEKIGYMKPKGYNKNKYTCQFFKRVELNISNRHIRARIFHQMSGGVLASASTMEWGVRKYLGQNLTNMKAVILIANILSQRGLKAGVKECYFEMNNKEDNDRWNEFKNQLTLNGLILEENDQLYRTEISEKNEKEYYQIFGEYGPISYMNEMIETKNRTFKI